MSLKRIEVAVGVLIRRDGRVLLARRPAGKSLPDYLEFPGGKIERGEMPESALVRELREELGVEADATALVPLIRFSHSYPDFTVRLHAYRVERWKGQPIGAEGQPLNWCLLRALSDQPLLPANTPLVNALTLPPLLRVTPVISRATFPTFEHTLKEALGSPGGEGILVRTEGKAVSDFVHKSLSKALQTSRHQVLLNTADIMEPPAGFSGLHIPARILMQLDRKPQGAGWIGASVHNSAEVRQAKALGLDYVVIGNVCGTPSHPGRPCLGWPGFADLAAASGLPAYAIGGVGPDDLAQAWKAWGQGVAGIRAFWPKTV